MEKYNIAYLTKEPVYPNLKPGDPWTFMKSAVSINGDPNVGEAILFQPEEDGNGQAWFLVTSVSEYAIETILL